MSAVLLLVAHVRADSETIDGVTYSYTVANGKAIIYNSANNNSYLISIGNDGRISFGGVNFEAAIPQSTTGDLAIPSVVGDYPVTSIGSWSFYGCNGLTSVLIPESVTSIASYAFYGCSNLTNVTITGSVLSIGNGAFHGCSNMTSMILPASVASIGLSAFYGCNKLESVTMRGDAPSVGNHAFSGVASGCVVYVPRQADGYEVDEDGKWQGMTVEYYGPEFTIDANGALTGVNLNGATGVVIPDGVTSIGENVFKDCASLKSVIIPEGVNEIGYYAFRGCSSLETVSLPSTLTNIVTAAFECCTSLRSIEIPASVTSIGTWLFNGCTSLVSVVMHEGIPSIPYKMFTGCSSLAEIDIPNGVADIGAEAFRDCRRLKKVTIPDSVASIGARTFWDCNNLASLSIPDSVTSIGYAAFAYCYDLADVTMGSGVISLGEYVFWSCSGLKSVTMKGNAPSVGDNAFNGINSDAVVRLPRQAGYEVGDDGKWQGMTVEWYGSEPEPEFTIDDNGVLTGVIDLHGATEIVIPAGVTVIGESVFEGCSGLASVMIPDSVTSIGEAAFRDCGSLTSVTIGNGVTSIPAMAFLGCSILTSVTIPDSVTSIGYGAFYGCSGLTSVTIPAGVTVIGVQTFRNCSGLTSVTIPDSVTSIGEEAFDGCSGLTSVTIPNGVTSIGDKAFQNCSGLTNVTIPDSVTGIGRLAFSSCSGMLSFFVGSDNAHYSSSNGLLLSKDGKTLVCGVNGEVVIPDGVSSIGDYAFFWYSGLTSVTIGNGVTSIGKSAFANCTSLTNVTMKGNAPSVGSWAFDGIGENAVVHLPAGASGYELNARGKWQVMAVEYYDGQGCTFTVDGQGGLASANINGATEAVIPGTVKSIGDNVFSGGGDLTRVTIPESVEAISPTAFGGCEKLWAKWFRTLERLSDGDAIAPDGVAGTSEVALTVTNVVVHYVTTAAVSEAVTPSEDVGIVSVIAEVGAGKPVAISSEWAAQYLGFASKFGNDFTAAITKPTGKRDGAGNAMMVWQDFVAGTDPTDENDVFRASITFDKETNEPVISWTPELSEAEAAKRKYTTYGKAKLTDKEWTPIAEGEEENYNFFKVTVEMR